MNKKTSKKPIKRPSKKPSKRPSKRPIHKLELKADGCGGFNNQEGYWSSDYEEICGSGLLDFFNAPELKAFTNNHTIELSAFRNPGPNRVKVTIKKELIKDEHWGDETIEYLMVEEKHIEFDTFVEQIITRLLKRREAIYVGLEYWKQEDRPGFEKKANRIG